MAWRHQCVCAAYVKADVWVEWGSRRITQQRCQLCFCSHPPNQPTNPTITLYDRLRTSPSRATQFNALRLQSNSFLLQSRQLQKESSCKRDWWPMLFGETGVTETRPTVNTHNSETCCLLIHQTLRSRKHTGLRTACCVRTEADNTTPDETGLALWNSW